MPNRRWPAACQARLMELVEIVPPLKNAEIARRIAQMPEASSLILTKDAVCGKMHRMRKWSPEFAIKFSRRKRLPSS